MLAICRYRYLPIGPLTGQVNAHTCDYSGLVLKAECSEVKAEHAETKKRKEENDH